MKFPQAEIDLLIKAAIAVRHDDDLHGRQSLRQHAEAVKYQGTDRARFFQIVVDQMLETLRTKEPPTSCRKGCSACCGLAITLTPNEATLLAETAKSQGVTIDLTEAKRQSSWQLIDYGQGRCVVLGKDGACRLYAVRPMVCRNHAVTSSPEFCDPKTIDHRVKRLSRFHVRALINAVHGENAKLLPQLLHEAQTVDTSKNPP